MTAVTVSMPRRLNVVRLNAPGARRLFVDFRLLELRDCVTAATFTEFANLDDMLAWIADHATYEE